MSLAGEKLRVLIATTSGPVEILLLTEEDPAIGRSVACIGGTTDTADIAAAYHAFVARPTGLIERLFGHPCYRLDVSGRIDAGSSWQLGVLAAHALFSAGRLAQENDTAAGVIWATGSVRPVDLTVGGVSHLPEKLAASMERLKQEAAAGRRVLVTIPAENASALSADLKADLATLGIKVLELSSVQTLWDSLTLKVSKGPQRIAANLAVPSRARNRRRWGVAAAGLLCVASAALYLLGRSPAPVADQEQLPAPAPVRREAEVLVPEIVPFISDRDRETLRAVYLSAPDHKALAMSSGRMGFTTAQPDEETAKTAAIAACQRATEAARLRSRCELYAVGKVVVSNRGRPPMPQQPWVIRDPSIDRPFAVADIPLVTETARAAIEKDYTKSRKSKALALSPSGFYSAYTNETGIEEAVRRALERCGSNSGAACMIIALDDMFVVPIPKAMKVVGLSRPAAINAMAPELRDDVARRLGNATSGWNAVAVGASGRAGVKLGAESELAAIDGSMADCSRHDRECRVAVIGPFLVERAPSTNATPSSIPAATPTVPQASQTPDAMTSSSVIAALALAAPGLTVSARDDLAKKYGAMKEHKALAVVPGASMHWRSADWLTAELAEEGVLERCQVAYMTPCALLAVNGRAQAAPADGKWPARDMARARYVGTFDPDRIPGVSQSVRARPDVVAYRNAAGPKAAAFHPWGRIFTVLTAENQRAAEALVLSNCNADPTRQGQDGPCHLYAIGDQVVLLQRRTGPLTP